MTGNFKLMKLNSYAMSLCSDRKAMRSIKTPSFCYSYQLNTGRDYHAI